MSRHVRYRAQQRALLGDVAYKEAEAKRKREARARAKDAAGSAGSNPPEQKVASFDQLHAWMKQLQEMQAGPEKTKLAKAVNTQIEKKLEQPKNRQECIDYVLSLAKEAGRPVQRKSVSQYVAAVSLIYKRMNGKTFDCTKFTFLDDVDGIVKYLKGKYKNKNTYNTQLNAISSILRYIPKQAEAYAKWTKLNTDGALAQQKARDDNALNTKQIASWVNYPEFAKLETKIKEPEQLAIWRLYTHIAPRRNGTYANVVIRGPEYDTKSKEENFINVSKTMKPLRIVLNKYKTSRHYGRYTIDLSKHPKLQLALWDYLKKKPRLLDTPLFITNGYQNRVLKVFRKYTGKPKFTMQLMRNIYASWAVSDNTGQRKSRNDLKDIAAAMGHSIDQLDKYRKII